MKILYVADININNSQGDGVFKKVQAQVDAMRRLGAEVWLACFQDDNILCISNGIAKSNFSLENTRYHSSKFKQIYKLLVKIISQERIELLYFRYVTMDFFQVCFLKRLKLLNISIFIEIPTYPYWGERKLQAIQAWDNAKYTVALRIYIKRILELIFLSYAKRYIDRIITFSKHKMIWDIITIPLYNAVDVQAIFPRNQLEFDGILHMIVVANVSNWHGIDRILEGIRIYKSKYHNCPYQLRIIGDGSELPKLKILVDRYELNDVVEFCGKQFGEQLNDLYNWADVGLASFGVHRKGILMDCSLKTREYLAKGIPCVGSDLDEQIINSPLCKFYLPIPSDETPINIENIWYFAEKYMYDKEITNIIRKEAELYLDWTVQMKKIIDAFIFIKNENRRI